MKNDGKGPDQWRGQASKAKGQKINEFGTEKPWLVERSCIQMAFARNGFQRAVLLLLEIRSVAG